MNVAVCCVCVCCQMLHLCLCSAVLLNFCVLYVCCSVGVCGGVHVCVGVCVCQYAQVHLCVFIMMWLSLCLCWHVSVCVCLWLFFWWGWRGGGQCVECLRQCAHICDSFGSLKGTWPLVLYAPFPVVQICSVVYRCKLWGWQRAVLQSVWASPATPEDQPDRSAWGKGFIQGQKQSHKYGVCILTAQVHSPCMSVRNYCIHQSRFKRSFIFLTKQCFLHLH